MIATIVSWFSALFAWIARFFQWFKGLFLDFMEFIADIPTKVFGAFLDGVIYLLNMIPVPGFLSEADGLQRVMDGLGPEVLYFVNFFGIHIGLGIIGGGVLFRLTRKAMTLGQW